MSAENNIIKLGITVSLLFAADSAVNTSSVNAASLKDLSADAQEQDAIPTETPQTVELIASNRPRPELMFYQEFSQQYPGWANLINEGTPQVREYMNSHFPGLDVPSFNVVVPSTENGNSIVPTQTPGPDNNQRVTFLYSHLNGGVEAQFDPQNTENPWAIRGYDNYGMVASVVEPAYHDLLESPSEEFLGIVSNWYVVPNNSTGNLELVDLQFPRLGAIADGVPSVNENGQNTVEWRRNYSIQDNVRLVEMSLAEDDDIGKEPAPGYVLENDVITVDNLGLTLRLATVMSADPEDPHNTLARYEFTPEFEGLVASFANNYMQEFAGYDITIRLVDDEDEATRSYLRTTSLDNETFLRFAVGSDNYTPTLAFGGEPAQENKIYFNAFGARTLPVNDREMQYLTSSTIANSIVFIESKIHPWRGNPYTNESYNINQKIIELGVNGLDNLTPAVTIHNPS
ncbi:hypothetical protein A2803_00835 [Candidatus Woesebacteria bacterium RIFCSPHIGHO2_01_FULL_44_21]|uniref:Uncharacterized protein n=1 Tax=Candidatus Woesebacteria bacterium RIFCSPHIGHO2_01_FULL_44_21 TaxID=1802503 RepID=A0A1F7Z048_9BACT|nr:MAG: hypothetical protein A2803_00835 [Candidatus Woesebacteria bacterium RIFCSPHIGHO2_01_FULL_44_21]OGM70047.1 MAG: hypothetical protein A2897_00020 [Candidatus Woesebacteria bacterium RIFCSPLOWO2_01_FULL_44_24b]